LVSKKHNKKIKRTKKAMSVCGGFGGCGALFPAAYLVVILKLKRISGEYI